MPSRTPATALQRSSPPTPPRAASLGGRTTATTLALAFLAACPLRPANPPPPAAVPTEARRDLAPSGTLRAAINFGNPILARRDPATGGPQGVSVDLARELARRLDVPVELITYTAAGQVVEGIRTGAWDIAFFAIDPVRAADVDFTPPYVVIEGAYLVPEHSPIGQNADVDREGVRIAAARGSAYDLHLTRELKHARIVHAPTSQAVTDLMVAEKLEVAAGVKQQLQADAQRLPGLRLLEGRFMVINQAMTLPKGRPAGLRYLADFVEEMKGSGLVGGSLQRHGIEGAMVAPAAR